MKQVEKDNNEDYGAQFLSVPVVGMDERTSFFCLARGWLTGYGEHQISRGDPRYSRIL